MLDAARYPRSEVRFDSGGNTLHGWLYGEGGKSGVIIISAGINSGADSHLAEIMAFADEKKSVIEAGKGSLPLDCDRVKVDELIASVMKEAGVS